MDSLHGMYKSRYHSAKLLKGRRHNLTLNTDDEWEYFDYCNILGNLGSLVLDVEVVVVQVEISQ